jgi:nicotinate dehydrogenase subunit A
MRTAVGASLGPDTPLTLPLARAPPSPRLRGEGRGEGSGAPLLPAQQRHALMRLRAFAGEILMQSTSLVVNGSAVSVTADADTPLLDVLRNHLGLMGTKFGCGQEQCGCCMVLVDGRPEKSCGKPLSTMAGKAIVTIEGLGTPERPHALQRAFLDEQAGQCGYCLAGILISAKALLDRNPSPSRAEIAEALDDNICRCGSHVRILRAVERAAALLREGAVR